MSDYYCLVAGLGSAAVSAIFYAVYKNREGVIQSLQDAVVLEIGPKLVASLTTAGNHSIPYGVVIGEAQPMKKNEVIKSPYVNDVKAVLQKVKTREHKSEWSKTTRLWHDVERTISSASTSVPFGLFKNGTLVKVLEPLSAENLPFKVIYDKFEPVSNTVAESLVQWASGDKTKGFQTVEEVLPVGTTLTGIGEITLSDNGIRISPPKSGLTYYLSQLTLDAIIRHAQSRKKVWKGLSVLFACSSGILVLVSLYLYYRRWRQRQLDEEFIRRIRDEGLVEGEGVIVEGQEACVICMDRPRNVVILDCGHICACLVCALQLNNCPVCRRGIDRLIPTYNS